MSSGLRGPQTETIMVLGCENNHLESSLFQSDNPLFSIEVGRKKQSRIFCAITPLASCEGVHAKMNERSKFKLLPCVLLWGGYDISRKLHLLVGSENIGKCQFLFKVGIGTLTASYS